MEDLKLTPSELEAKTYILKMAKNAYNDIEDGNDMCLTLPEWYDAGKFKRGQKYFFDNRFGMLKSNLYGLITLLADPKGLDILDSTGRSSMSETARKRYVSTTLQMISWYENDLNSGSSSWVSLNRIRKMHSNASITARNKKIGFINQTDVTYTTFGFMGFALIRSQYFGIRSDNKEDREGFIHFWAVIGHMLGIADQFNMCLFDIETVEQICMILLRYMFIPLIQLASPKFKQMVNALLDGMSPFVLPMTYDLEMFTIKRIIGVPGYQYNVDLSKETICRQIFSNEELILVKTATMTNANNVSWKIYDTLFDHRIPISMEMEAEKTDIDDCNNKLGALQYIGDKSITWIMISKDSHEWKSYLNDSQFQSLNTTDKFKFRLRYFVWKFYENSVGRYFYEMGTSALLYVMRRYHESK